MEKRILLSMPHMSGTEQKYISEAFEGSWIVPLGPHVNEFELRLQHFLGENKSVVALSAGTAAIHLGLIMLGVSRDDEVICQDLTFSASCNPICYQGAIPVFVDSEPETMNIDPVVLEEAIIDRKKYTGRYPKAIVVVHLYGMPAKMDEIMAVASKYGIPVLEDAAEALGSEYSGRKAGTFGEYGALSFNGNKIITTSGGGALICPDKECAARVLFLATQARENRPYYYHTTIGYNYRLSNISGCIGCGQIDVLDERLARRRAIHDIYARELACVPGISVQMNPSDKFNSNFWLSTIQVNPELTGCTPDEIRVALADKNIETRLLWRPMHMMPVFEKYPYYGNAETGRRLFENGLCLPSGSSLTDEDILRVCRELKACCK
ncbi:MAG: aminotransferase class I/II-fold pyridoxal phosphate-dependent enzyme [Muribaculaceae bacterium]|nr:aminotransferase class I/II-fold pyridoxal phosphate-dependent enzyme [Muribaculaceae bacterium]